MAISTNLIRELRERTGCGVQACKEALHECKDNLDQAIEYLRKKGMIDAEKKSGQQTNAGRIFSYIHGKGEIGILLEMNCSTDFVANTDMFQELGKDLCLQVCATKPLAVRREDVPKETIEHEKEAYQKEVANKPPKVQEKIIEGKLNKFYQETVLLEQLFIKDETRKIEDLIKEKIAVLKENITVKRFIRFQMGEK